MLFKLHYRWSDAAYTMSNLKSSLKLNFQNSISQESTLVQFK